MSNERKVIESFEKDERADAVKELSIDDTLPNERTLGLMLNIEQDEFHYNTNIPEKPMTRRGILSMASTIFDPLGFLSPVILHPKLLLQRLTREKLDWDDTIDEIAKNIWDRWYSNLTALNGIKIPRCVTLGIQDDSTKEIHVFCDASQYAYAAVAYMKITDKAGSIKTSILKSGTPSNDTTT